MRSINRRSLLRSLKPKVVIPDMSLTMETTMNNQTVSLNKGGSTASNYNITVDWGDGNIDQFTSASTQHNHIYATAGTYTVIISGDVNSGGGFNCQQEPALKYINEFKASIEISEASFSTCQNLIEVRNNNTPVFSTKTVGITARNLFRDCSSLIGGSGFQNWDVSNVGIFQEMFLGCSSLTNPTIENWNVFSGVIFISMFQNCSNFDVNLSNWNLVSATTLNNMFQNCLVFNNGGDSGINNWNTSSVTSMSGTFNKARAFNQPLGNWNVSNVTTFNQMFRDTNTFNQNIGGWNVSSCTNFQLMFLSARDFNNGNSSDINSWTFATTGNISIRTMFALTNSFNQPLNNWNTERFRDISQAFESSNAFNSSVSDWDLSNCINFDETFKDCPFNQELNSWTINNSENVKMEEMFLDNTAFNQPLNLWDVSTVNNMLSMFSGATSFNGNITTWNVSNVSSMQEMFKNADSFNQNIGAWNTDSLTSTFEMFFDTALFDQDLGNWDVTNLTDAERMFNQSNLSTANYDSILIGWESQLVQNNVLFGASTSNYTLGGAAETARTNLINDHSWVIADGGGI